MSTDKKQQAVELDEGQLDQAVGGAIAASEPPDPNRIRAGEPPEPGRIAGSEPPEPNRFRTL